MSTDGRLGVGDVLVAFMAGAVVGAVAALLTAPAEGRKTREMLGEKAREGQDRAAALAKQGREVLNKQRDNIVSAIDRGREAYQEALTESGKSEA